MKQERNTKEQRTPRVITKKSSPGEKIVPDYKDTLTLKRFVTDRGKLMHQSYTGLTARAQRSLSTQVKRARYMALLPYTDRHAL